MSSIQKMISLLSLFDGTVKKQTVGDITNAEGLVNYYGEDYRTVLDQEGINKIIELAKKNKMANMYDGMESKCLSISWKYEEWILGFKGKANEYKDADVDATIQKMADSINNGYPVVAKVNTQKGSRHFVLVIGIKDNATVPYKQSDFLCIDSYDGQVDGMGGSGNVDGNYRTLYMQDGTYWIGSMKYEFA